MGLEPERHTVDHPGVGLSGFDSPADQPIFDVGQGGFAVLGEAICSITNVGNRLRLAQPNHLSRATTEMC